MQPPSYMKTNGFNSKLHKKGAGVGVKDEGGAMEEGGSTDGDIMNKGGITKEGVSVTDEPRSYFLVGGVDVATCWQEPGGER